MFIELQELADPHVTFTRRLYVNVDTISFVSATAENAPAVINFCCAHGQALPVRETFETVQNLIDTAEGDH